MGLARTGQNNQNWRGGPNQCQDCGKDIDRTATYCASCARLGERNVNFGKPLSAETRAKMSAAKRGRYGGKKNPMWGRHHTVETKRKISKANRKTGHRKTTGGYIRLFAPNHPNAQADGWAPEHRLVISRHLGRPLKEKEIVHHINEDRADNRLENLHLFEGHAAHFRHHESKALMIV